MIEYRLSGAPMATVTTRIARAGGSTPTLIQGYAALYGVETTIGNFFRERIMAGAFRDAIRRDDVRALFNHEAHFVLGRTASGTLRLSEDAKGLKYEIDINAYDSMARDVAARIQRGDVSGSSFGFIVHEDDERWEYDRTSRMPLRTLLRVGLIDVSPVTFPVHHDDSCGAIARRQ